MRRSLLALLIAAVALCTAALAEEVEVAPIVTMEASVVTEVEPIVTMEANAVSEVTPTPAPALAPTPEPTPTPETAEAVEPTPAIIFAATVEPTPAITSAATVELTPAITFAATVEPTPAITFAATVEPAATVAPAVGPGLLMADSQGGTAMEVGGIFAAGSTTVLGSSIPRTSITSVRFEDSLAGAPESAWDASAEKNGSVLAWVSNDGALTIAGEGGVRANPNSSHLFAGYSAATKIDFNGCFSTEGVTNMAHMFESCWSLQELDATALDTSRATNLSYMFSSCMELTELDVTGFDTRCAVSMEGMFLLDVGLTELDVTHFDTRNVMSMRSMFESCSGIEYLDLYNFRTIVTSDMSRMFGDCAALKRVTFGPEFRAAGEMSGMFDGCTAQLRIDGREMDAAEWSSAGRYTELKLWDRNDDVRWLQTRLLAAGYDPRSTDGVFGHDTESALMAWQSAHGFVPNAALTVEQVWLLMK